MTVLEVIEREKECVLRQDTVYCNRDCAKCDLVLDSNTVLKAYDVVIEMLKLEGIVDRFDSHLSKKAIAKE